MSGLKKITCDPMCGFEVTSHDEDELVTMGMMHVTKQHPEMKVTKEEMEKKMMDA